MTFGALIPEGYQLSTVTPEHPWICPIRSCRRVFAKIPQLGSHFNVGVLPRDVSALANPSQRLHRGAQLHDNEDGTLSERTPAFPRRGGSVQKQPAVVVSRGPADPSEPGPVAPSYPAAALRGQALGLSSLGTKKLLDETNESSPVQAEEHAQDEHAEDLWSYLQPHLVKHQGPKIPTQGWVRHLITLPQVRQLDWNRPWLSTHPFSDTNPRDISALIVQVTGEPAPSPCDRCREGKGPFSSCIMISTKAASGPVGNILSCANCFYHFGQTYCTHKQWGTERAKKILKARRERAPFDESPDEMRADGEDENNFGTTLGGIVANDDESMDDQESGDDDMDDGIMDEEIMDNSAVATPLTPDGVPNNISEAEPGRLYTMWPGESNAEF